MAKLVHLRTLCAGHNRIKSIASQIGHIKYLRRLEVDHNVRCDLVVVERSKVELEAGLAALIALGERGDVGGGVRH